ncbi:MAG: aminopeptidase P family protein [Ignavibacteriales bacterium]|nr:aminopeptidase P family protein [Ignavibacteriales bacterium]
MTQKRCRLMMLLWLLPLVSFAQEGFSPFTKDFSPEEFAQRRAKIYDAIGSNAFAVLHGAPSPAGYTRFRQYNEFYYLCGVEVPYAYLLLDGSSRTATLYLPHRNEGRERSEGKLFSAEDADEVKTLTGVNAVFGSDLLSEHLGWRTMRGTARTVYTMFTPGEGASMSRDLAIRQNSDTYTDPWDGRISREAQFIKLLRERLPLFEIRDLTPTLDNLRVIKSPAEITLIKKATKLAGLALMEGMRSAKPNIKEYELDGMAKYVYFRNGAQGEAYYSLIASGPNATFPHYNAGKRTMLDGELLLFDFAPDFGYYMSDLTRMMPVNGKFNAWQRELYGFYIGCYNAILKAIRPNATGQAILQEAVKEMDVLLAATKFSKPLYEKACRAFVGGHRKNSQNPNASLGHWVGMATHDDGPYGGIYKPGMVFTIEPALRVPEEKIYIRLEDLIVITEKGAEIVSDFVPMDIDGIEKLMREEGMLQRYPRAEIGDK